MPLTADKGSLTQPADALTPTDYRGRRVWAGAFDPLTLETDAARFQYKADADAAGVTQRLRGVEQWDPTASGKVLVFEARDGARFIADGHQRLGLARRLAGDGFEGVRLDGYMLREADGWTAREARVVAALKNIREGSGTALDAAKVFREAPQALRDRSLPVTGELIAQARGLATLSKDAFEAVVNKVIPERWGAEIGAMAPDRPDMHADLVGLLKRAEPRDTLEARSILQEGLLDEWIVREGVQTDLFGALPPEATTLARGRIKAAILRALKADARLYGLLVAKADAIETGGNVLARDANQAALAIDRAAMELVSKLALRTGTFGERMAQAAREVIEGKRPADAAKGLIASVREAIRKGETLDLMRGEAFNPDPPPARAVEELQAFDRPAGEGQRAQIEPKAEERDFEALAMRAGEAAEELAAVKARLAKVKATYDDDFKGEIPEDVVRETVEDVRSVQRLEEEIAALEAEVASQGALFDDLPAVGAEERALQRLKVCAPGGGA